MGGKYSHTTPAIAAPHLWTAALLDSGRLINAVVLLVAIGGIAWAAIRRFQEPASVAGVTVIWVAQAGVAVNAVTAGLFRSGRHDDLNIRGAFLHMAAGAGVSLGVAVAGVAILWNSWTWLDPAVSLVVVVVILAGTWGLLRDSVNLALDAVPADIDETAVLNYLTGLPGVVGVHDLHIWALSTTETALTAHLVMAVGGGDALLVRVCAELHDQFGIEHATVQIETGDPAYPCGLEPSSTVLACHICPPSATPERRETPAPTPQAVVDWRGS